MMKDTANPNRLAIAVNGMVAVITDEDTTKLKKTSAVKKDEKAAKIAGIKANMKKALLETDVDLRYAYERWIDGMIDAANCRFTKAVVQLFEKTVTEHTSDKNLRLKIIEIATVNSYKDATWAINRVTGFRASTPTKLPEQKICTGVSDNVTF
jgi:chemotaxis regulatin CheY-phosphate phosphatase CheZ